MSKPVKRSPSGDLVQRTPSNRHLGLFDSVSVLVGTIIGLAIFLTPGVVAIHLQSLAAVLLIWLLGGLLSLFGALSLSELGAIFPEAGGLYVYLSRAYGPAVGFLYGWGLFIFIQTASIAAVAAGFALYFGHLFPLSHAGRIGMEVLAIFALTATNCFGVCFGKLAQNCFTVLKLGGLSAMILILLLRGPRLGLLFRQFWPQPPYRIPWIGVGIALVAVLWTYEGWHLLSFVADEVKEPARILPRSYFCGMLVVALAYLVANTSYYAALPASEIAHDTTVAATAMGRAIGPLAATLISLLIVISILGALNGLILTGPHVYFAMARDKLFFPGFARIHSRFGTPAIALIAQGIWAAGFTFIGSYQDLLTDAIFGAWIFYGLAVASVILLRLRQPDLPRPFRVPGYPWLPIAFCLAAAGLSVSTVVSRPRQSFAGVAVILTGVPVYWFLRSGKKSGEPQSSI